MGSAPEDGELRSARPRARTWAQPRKTANSAPPDPGLGLGLSPGRRRTPLRPTQGSDMGSAPKDGELRSARPRARTRAQPWKTANSALPDPGLGLGLSPGRRRTPLRPTPGLGHGLSPGRRRTPLRPTQGSDMGSAPKDGELRSARPRARTRAQPWKTANSALPDPGLGLGLSPERRRTPLRPTPGLGHGLSPGRRRTPLRPTQGSDMGSTPEDDELHLARP
jgi:predicted anti-sigma-YlaC factor YlaD